MGPRAPRAPGPPGPQAPRLGSRGIPGARRRGPLGPQASLGAIRVRRTPGPSGPQPWGLCRGARGHFKRAPRGPPGLEGGPPPPSRILPSTTPPVYRQNVISPCQVSLTMHADPLRHGRKRWVIGWPYLRLAPTPPRPPFGRPPEPRRPMMHG